MSRRAEPLRGRVMWEPYGPPMVTGARAALDANGTITSWEYEVWSATHNARPGAAGDLLAGQHIDKAFQPSPAGNPCDENDDR